jgi:exopolyphosphatase/guanosine-5'-triphosphate,3'-diphosphate pyrophosphatase
MQRLASIDIGSNTLRLLIADRVVHGPLRPIRVERRITRLGERFLPAGTLQPQAMSRSIGALLEFADLLKQMGVSRYLAGATAVVREAGNGEEFLRMVEREAGLSVHLLSSAEEARLAFAGAVSVIPNSGRFLTVFDIGGGSTELAWREAAERAEVESVSLPLGVVHLTEAFLQGDPPGSETCARLAQHVYEVLRRTNFPAQMDSGFWVGTAGTVTTLASMCLKLQQYDPERINGTVLDRVWLARLCADLAEMPIARRRRLAGLEPGREDIILAGALVTLELMQVFHISQFAVSDAGLLEGLFLDLCVSLSREPEDRASPDVL